MLKQYRQPIPYYYRHWSEGNRQLFIRYVKAYIEKNYPGWELLKIENRGKVALIRKKG